MTVQRRLRLESTTFSPTTTAITINAGTNGRWLPEATTSDEANGCDPDMTVLSELFQESFDLCFEGRRILQEVRVSGVG